MLGWEGKSFLPEALADEITRALKEEKGDVSALRSALGLQALLPEIYICINKRGKFPGRFPDSGLDSND